MIFTIKIIFFTFILIKLISCTYIKFNGILVTISPFKNNCLLPFYNNLFSYRRKPKRFLLIRLNTLTGNSSKILTWIF